MEKYDFSGWATRNDIRCSDGRIIRRDAFKHNDGRTVPLVWNHDHIDPEKIIGHALLENREEGVYTYGKFNDTRLGKLAKSYVEHGDITQLSIYANQLKQQGPNVMHGSIREVSLVMAGANPEAFIENVMLHGDELVDEAKIFTGLDIELCHSDSEKNEEEVVDEVKEEEKGEEEMAEETKKIDGTEVENQDEQIEHADKEETVADVFNTFSEKQKTVVYALIAEALTDDEDDDDDNKVAHADSESNDEDETIADVFNTFSEKQKTVVYAMIAHALEEAGVKEDANKEVKHSEGGDYTMKRNVFDQEERFNDTLSHGEFMEILKDAPKYGSLKETFLAHGIENIGELFPEAKPVNDEPAFVQREQSWVTDVLSAVHHTPFARIKSTYADITAEQARAKGYTKGGLKVEEVIKAFKRVTNPTTIYKKQKLDRDDMIDITDFNVVAWLKKEMRMMLNEEIARAVLFGDGREEDDTDKINEENIRPVWKDSDVYTYKEVINVTSATTEAEKVKAFIKAAVKARKHYKGSGRPVMYMLEDLVADCLLLEDLNGRRIYETVDKLAGAMGVSKIVAIPLENLTRKDKDENVYDFGGLLVNLVDYNIGTDKGGEVNMFDDFDIDYNQYKYLMEGRCSGALIKPRAAVAIDFHTEAAG